MIYLPSFILLIIFIGLLYNTKFGVVTDSEYMGMGYAQSVKGLMAIAIIYDHLSQSMRIGGFISFFQYLGYIIVCVFFIYSGYGISLSYKRKGNLYLQDFLFRRLLKVLIPFWLINILTVAVHLIFYKESFDAIQFLQYVSGIKLINSNSWYIINITFFYLFFFITRSLIKSEYKVFVVIVSLVAAYSLVLLVFHKTHMVISNVAFILGYLFAIRNDLILYLKRKSILMMLILLFFTTWSLGWLISNTYMSFIIKIFAAMFFSLMFLSLSWFIRIQNCVLNFFGKISLEIYLIHGVFRYLFKSELININIDIWYFLACVIGTLIVSFVIETICELIYANTLHLRKTRINI